MAIQPWDFDTLVENQAAAIQAAANNPINLAEGATMRAWVEAQGGVGLYLQGLMVKAIALSLFATRYGTDADEFGAQFGFLRLPAIAATGTLTFARYTDTEEGIILVGTLVATGDGTVQFAVTADPTNANWASQAGPNGGYIAAANVASIGVPVAAVVAGSGGNVIGGAISLIQSQVTNFDTVTNPAAFTNGLDAESDPAYKARFPLFLAGLASADDAAIRSAIAGVQQGLQYLLDENYDYPGETEDLGSFFALVDDGSHNPPSSLVTAVYDAINAVRGFCIRPQAYGVTALTVSLAGTIAAAPGYNATTVANAVAAAWSNWLNTFWSTWLAGLVPGVPVTPAKVTVAEAAAVAMAVPGCANVTLSTILINGENADLQLTLTQAPTPGTVTATA